MGSIISVGLKIDLYYNRYGNHKKLPTSNSAICYMSYMDMSSLTRNS